MSVSMAPPSPRFTPGHPICPLIRIWPSRSFLGGRDGTRTVGGLMRVPGAAPARPASVPQALPVGSGALHHLLLFPRVGECLAPLSTSQEGSAPLLPGSRGAGPVGPSPPSTSSPTRAGSPKASQSPETAAAPSRSPPPPGAVPPPCPGPPLEVWFSGFSVPDLAPPSPHKQPVSPHLCFLTVSRPGVGGGGGFQHPDPELWDHHSRGAELASVAGHPGWPRWTCLTVLFPGCPRTQTAMSAGWGEALTHAQARLRPPSCGRDTCPA